MNHSLNTIILKLDNTLQQYEFVQKESENLVKKIITQFSNFNDKLINEFVNYKEPNSTLNDIFANFNLILTGWSNLITYVYSKLF